MSQVVRFKFKLILNMYDTATDEDVLKKYWQSFQYLTRFLLSLL